MDGDFDAIADLPDDGARQMQIYARYGLAMYCAQVLEHGLVNAIVLTRRLNGHLVSERDWDAALDANFRKATSDLARRVGNYGGLDEHDRALLTLAVDERNRLAHDFFRDHSENAMSAVGMQRMVDDADAVRELFIRADGICERLVDQACAQLGVRPDAIEQIVAETRARIHARDGH